MFCVAAALTIVNLGAPTCHALASNKAIAMRLTPFALAAVLLAAPAARAVTVLDYPPPPGGYSGIKNYETYSIRGVVRAEDLNEFGNFVTETAVPINLDLSTFVDDDGFLFISLNGFGENADLGAILEAGQATLVTAISGGPTSMGSYSGFDGTQQFLLIVRVGKPTLGAGYEVNFSVNPLPAPAFALLSGLVQLSWYARRRTMGVALPSA